MIWSTPPKIISGVFRDTVWQIPNLENRIFLTFDDGPVPENTEWILTELEKFSVKSTFFCLGKNVEKYPDLYKKIIKSGHAAGSHGYEHLNGWKTENNEYFNDVTKAELFINSGLFRPPYGRIKPSQVKVLKSNYKIIMWSVLSMDFRTKATPEECVHNVVSNTKSGSIIVFHDSPKAEKNMRNSLPLVIETLLEKKFVFSLIDKNILQ